MSCQFKVITPINNSIYLEREYASNQDILKCIKLADASQNKWKHSSIEERGEICRKALDYFLINANEIAEELSWQMGRPLKYSPFEITNGFKERAEYMIDIAEKALEDIQIEDSKHFKRYIKREPIGVVCVLSPWNYPYLTSVNAVIPAIMAGNSVILKHSQQTPLCAERYAKAFNFAGLPSGVFQYLHVNHEQVVDLVRDPHISKIVFTGSVTGGKIIQQAVNHRFIAATLELGGKDPAYVSENADLNYSIENLVDGSFFNSGQSCCGIERIYVHKKVYKDFVDGFCSLTSNYHLGDPLDRQTTLGPMVKTAASQFVQEQIKDAIKSGATAMINASNFLHHNPDGPYLAPQVLVDVDHTMQIMTEETFGPVVGIMAVENDAEAIRLMNDSKYGLTASIWSKDVSRSIKIANQIKTGTCYLNRCDYLDPALAWTGLKDSGIGVSLSSIGYESLTRPKSFHFRLL